MDNRVTDAQERQSQQQASDKSPSAPPIHPIDRHVGHKVRVARIRAELSQTELGREIGLSYQQIQKYESGKNRISASMLYEIAKRLNIPLTEFFRGLPHASLQATDARPINDDECMAYAATSEGRYFIEEILRLSPRLRPRALAVLKVLAGDKSAEM